MSLWLLKNFRANLDFASAFTALISSIHEFWRFNLFTFVQIPRLMSQSTSLSIPEDFQLAFVQLQDEVVKLEKVLLEIRQKKHEILQHQLNMGIHNLATLANSINTLANNLESEILRFKKTGVEVNYLYQTIQESPAFKAFEQEKTVTNCWRHINIWKMNHSAVSVPTVIRRESQFVLTVKIVNLHQEILPQHSRSS